MLPISKRALKRTKQQRLVKVYFYLAFVFIGFYQPVDTFKQWLYFGRHKEGICKLTFNYNVVPIIHLCAQNLNEIKWDDRLAHNNHHEVANDFTTFIADGFLQLVWQPVDSLMRSLLFVPDK